MNRLKPLNTFAFRYLFGENESNNNLLSFLNSLLFSNNEEKIVELEVINIYEYVTKSSNIRTTIYSIESKTSTNTKLDIEIHLLNRRVSINDTANNIVNSYTTEKYRLRYSTETNKIASIQIANFDMLPGKKYYTKGEFLEEKKLTPLGAGVEMHFIELNKFKDLEDKDLQNNKLERWLMFFDEEISEKKLEELLEMDDDLRAAEKDLKSMNTNEEIMLKYLEVESLE